MKDPPDPGGTIVRPCFRAGISARRNVGISRQKGLLFFAGPASCFFTSSGVCFFMFFFIGELTMCARTRALAFLCAWSAPSQTRRFFCKSGELQRCPGAIVFEIDTSNPRMILQHSSEHTRGCALCAKNRKVERGTACAAAKGGHGNAHPNAQNAVVLPEHFFLLELAHHAAAQRSSIRAHVPVCARGRVRARGCARVTVTHTLLRPRPIGVSESMQFHSMRWQGAVR